MRKLKYLLFILMFANISVFAQKIEFDHAYFFNTDGSFLWELYYGMSNDQLIYQHYEGDNYMAEFRINILLSGRDGFMLQDSIMVRDIRSVTDNTLRDLIGQKRYDLPAGSYTLRLEYEDFSSKNVKTEEKTFTLINSDSNIELGDLQLARVLEKSEKESIFNKYGFYVVPNPEAVYATNQMDIYICHSYKVLYDQDDDSKYSIKYKILDAAKMPIRKELQNITVENKQNIYFTYFGTSLSGFPSGVYYVVVEIYKDQYLHQTKEKKFYIYNYEMPLDATIVFTEDELFELSEFATMTDMQVDEAVKMAKIVAHDTEKQLFDRLTNVKGKQRALYRFWQMRDIDTTTRLNETLVDFNRRIKYANRHFSTKNEDDGWNTDRGRVLIKYGFPDDKDINRVSMENRAWEEWHYTRYEGGAYFYFVERMGYNDYQLVHSTVTGEPYNPDWFDQYVPTDDKTKSPYELESEKKSK